MAWILYTAIVCVLISTSASENSKGTPRRHIYGTVPNSNSAQKVYTPLVALGYLSKSVTDKCGNAGNIFLHLSKKKTATNLDELLGGLFEIVEATSEIIDGWIPELGKILKNMIISIVWVEACFPDSPLGKQVNGDLPAICAKEVSSHPGWEYFEEGFDSPLYTISYYRLAGIYDKIGQMLKTYGAGKNLDDLVGTPTIVGEAVVDIANVFKQDEMSWDLKVLSEVFAKLTTITAAVAENSYKTLGVHVVDGIHKFCSGIGKDYGLDISPHLSEIKDKISHSTCHSFENTLKKCVKNVKLNFDQFSSAEDDGTNAAARMISKVMKAFDDTINNGDDSTNDESKSSGNKSKVVSAVFSMLKNFMRPKKDKNGSNRNNGESNTSKHSSERDVTFIPNDDFYSVNDQEVSEENVNFGPSDTDESDTSTQAFIDVEETISLFETNSDESKKDLTNIEDKFGNAMKYNPNKDDQGTRVQPTTNLPVSERVTEANKKNHNPEKTYSDTPVRIDEYVTKSPNKNGDNIVKVTTKSPLKETRNDDDTSTEKNKKKSANSTVDLPVKNGSDKETSKSPGKNRHRVDNKTTNLPIDSTKEENDSESSNETKLRSKKPSKKTSKNKANINETTRLPNTKTKDDDEDCSSSEEVEFKSKKPTVKSVDQINDKPSTKSTDNNRSDKSTARLPADDAKDRYHNVENKSNVQTTTVANLEEINYKHATKSNDKKSISDSPVDKINSKHDNDFSEGKKSKIETSTVATIGQISEKYTTKPTNEYNEKPTVKLPIDEKKEHPTESIDKNKENINKPSDKINEDKVVDETNNKEYTKLSVNNEAALNKSTTETPTAKINHKQDSESSEKDDDYSPFRFSLFPLLKGLMSSVATDNDKSDEVPATPLQTKPIASDLPASKDQIVSETSTTKLIDDSPSVNKPEENKNDKGPETNPQTKLTTSDLPAPKDQIVSKTSTVKVIDDLSSKNKTSGVDKDVKVPATNINKNDHQAINTSNLHEPKSHTTTEKSTAKIYNETPSGNKTTEIKRTNKNPDSLNAEKKNKTSFVVVNKKDNILPLLKLDKESSHELSNENGDESDSKTLSDTTKPIESEEYVPWYNVEDALLGKVTQEEEGPKPLASLGSFSSSVAKVCKRSPDLLVQLSRTETPKNFKEAMNGIFGVVRAVSGVLDAWVPDLGTTLANMMMAIVKIESCVPHSKYIKGISGTPCVCDKDFGGTWGWEPFQGTYDHALNVTERYSLDRVWSKVATLLEDHGKGKPLKDLAGTPAMLAQCIYQISTIFRHASTWNHPAMANAFVKFTTILGAIGHSSGRPDLADTMVDEFIDYVSNIGKYYRIDLKPERSTIMTNILKCTNNTLGGALLLAGDNEVNSDKNSGEITSSNNKNPTEQTTLVKTKDTKPKAVSDNIDVITKDQTIKPRKNDTKTVPDNKEQTNDKEIADKNQNAKKDLESRADNFKFGDNKLPHGTITVLKSQSDENPMKTIEDSIKADDLDDLEHIPFGKENSESHDKTASQNDENQNIYGKTNEAVPAVREETKIVSDDQVKKAPTTTNQNVGNVDTDCSDDNEKTDKAKKEISLAKDNKNSKKSGLSLYQLLSNMFKNDDSESDESIEKITTPAAIGVQTNANNDNIEVNGSAAIRIKKKSKRDINDSFGRQTETPFQFDTQIVANYEKDIDNNTKAYPEKFIDNRIDVDEVGSGENSTPSSIPTEQDEEPFMAVGFVARGTSDKGMNWDDFLHSFFGDFHKTSVNQPPSGPSTVIKT